MRVLCIWLVMLQAGSIVYCMYWLTLVEHALVIIAPDTFTLGQLLQQCNSSHVIGLFSVHDGRALGHNILMHLRRWQVWWHDFKSKFCFPVRVSRACSPLHGVVVCPPMCSWLTLPAPRPKPSEPPALVESRLGTIAAMVKNVVLSCSYAKFKEVKLWSTNDILITANH